MTKTLTLAELRKMAPADLGKEVTHQRSQVAALRLAVALRKEKGTHLLRASKKQLARMLTVLRELQHKAA